jgi:hypothetical protein
MPNLNYSALWFWFNVAQSAFTAGIGVYVWWSNREKVTAGKFSRLEKQVSDRVTKTELAELEREHKARLDRHRREMVETTNKLLKMENDICHLPTQQDMRSLSGEISGLRSSLGEVSGKLGGVNRAVDLINGFLIEKGLTAK